MKKFYIILCLLCGAAIFGLGYYIGCVDNENDCILCNQQLLDDEI